MCTCSKHVSKTSNNDQNLESVNDNCSEIEKCPICTYHQHLSNLPSLPDMVFNKNLLRLEHKTGVAIEFNALDALKQVDETSDPLRVAIADDWQTARSGCPFVRKIAKPYDWTFTTPYKGTLKASENGEKSFIVNDTSDRIDVNKLKVREEILFYDEVPLFEDELADHGVSEYSVKLRIMPNIMFVLARFYLRIDNALARINDTRLYFESTNNYILREYTNREANLNSLANLKISTLINSNELSPYLSLIEHKYEKLLLPT